ncbi:hypothetical protein AAHE18_14G102700 [Arachis hypogaea]
MGYCFGRLSQKRLGRNGLRELRMGVIRLARAYTENEKIIKFEGCYHGLADPFLVKAGSGVATLGLPDSPGVPKGATSGNGIHSSGAA